MSGLKEIPYYLSTAFPYNEALLCGATECERWLLLVNMVTDLDDVRWDAFFEDDPLGTFYNLSQVLSSTGIKYERILWQDSEGNDIAAAAFPASQEERMSLLIGFLVYQGVYLKRFSQGIPNHRAIKSRVDVLTQVVADLIRHFPEATLSVSSEIMDIRPFSWIPYTHTSTTEVAISTAYTTVLDVSHYPLLSTYLPDIRSGRRYDYRKAVAREYGVLRNHDVSMFLELYQNVFSRQGTLIPDVTMTALGRWIERLLDIGYIDLSYCRTMDGVVESAIVTGHDATHTYYMFGATSDLGRGNGAGTFHLVYEIFHAREQGRHLFDFVGVNSPNRGDFKISFNGTLVPYFEVSWKSLEQP